MVGARAAGTADRLGERVERRHEAVLSVARLNGDEPVFSVRGEPPEPFPPCAPDTAADRRGPRGPFPPSAPDTAAEPFPPSAPDTAAEPPFSSVPGSAYRGSVTCSSSGMGLP